MLGFIKATVDTLNPRGGNGMNETIIILALVGALVLLSIYKIPIPEQLSWIITVIIGYMIGGNKPKKKGEKLPNDK